MPKSAQILSTKLFIPARRNKAVERLQLLDKLLSAINSPGTFILVSGPAGFGKTTLLSEFADRSHKPIAWVSLDDNDNNPIHFWTYIAVACQSVLENVGDSALDLLDSSQQLPETSIPTLLINDLTEKSQSLVLILDDFHVIQDASIHASMTFLLDHLPPNLHIILSTRTDPPWPLARYRARNQLTELRAHDLRFRVEEAEEFLNQTMQLSLTSENIAALSERTEGWIAGLQLAALSLQGHSDVARFIQDFTGSHMYIAEYLIEEILHKQSKDLHLFLLQTSILEQMNAELCEAVTAREDSQAFLIELLNANAFIVPLDTERHWFRYHHLFADLLRARLKQYLSADEIDALHIHASVWNEQNGFVFEAVKHALAGSDIKRAAALIDRAGQSMLFSDQNSLKHWLEALPEESFIANPRLEIYRTLISLSQGKLDMSEQTLSETEALVNALPPSVENDRLRLEALVYLLLFLAHQNTSRAIQIAHEVLSELPEEDVKLRSFLYSTLYRAYGMDGDIEKSAPAYRECLRLAQIAGQYGMVSVTTMVRAFDLCQYGLLDEAVQYCQTIIDAGAQRKVFHPAGPAFIGLAGIFLERNKLELAEEILTKGITLCQQSGSDGLYTGYIQKARLKQAQGDLPGALDEIQLLEQTFQRWDFTLTARHVSVLLAMDNVAGASLLIEPMTAAFNDSSYAQRLPLIAQEAFKLCLVRIHIAQGEFNQASQLLDEIQDTVEPGQRFGRLMEVYLLRAMIEQKYQSNVISDEALYYLERALQLGEPAGYMLLFLEEGPALIPILNFLARQAALPDKLQNYTKKLLTAFATVHESTTSQLRGKSEALIESLTLREMEVLQLLATGDSNQDIAEKLFITVRTVKKHTTNILGKLGVTNRTQAAARAHDLGLIISD